MMIILGILLIGTGYAMLYTVSLEASFEEIVNRVFGAIVFNIGGATLILLWLIKRSR